MKHILGQTRKELAALAAELGQPAYRARQLWDWLHAKRVGDYAAMPNLPGAFRAALAALGAPRTLRQLECRRAADGLTAKWLYAAGGDNAEADVEAVLIVERELRRRTVCVSSMAGCPLGCVFCATGGLGFVRNLESGEMVEQVYLADAFCRAADPEAGVSHIVFMGMGEPLLNLDEVLGSAAILADPAGLGLSGRHITISTAGVPDGIRRLAAAGVNYRLALSLHAPNQALREKLMPAARTWPLNDVFAALREFAATASRDITFEYCLIDDVNASPKEARELVRLLSGFRCKVNLIPLNPITGFTGRAPTPDHVRQFRDILEDGGVPATIRVEKGREINAACGQLKAERRTKG